MGARGPKPGAGFGGRKKGAKNKVSADLKAMILGALDAKGGQEYLSRQAEQNPTAFLALIGKVLPMTVAGDAENPVKTVLTVRWAGQSN